MFSLIEFCTQDLWDMRISKLRSSVDTFVNSGGVHASLDHLTQLEINSIRPLLPDALNMLQSLQQVYFMIPFLKSWVKKKLIL